MPHKNEQDNDIVMAVEGLGLEKIGIEANLVPKKAEFFVRTRYPKSNKIHFREIILIETYFEKHNILTGARLTITVYIAKY